MDSAGPGEQLARDVDAWGRRLDDSETFQQVVRLGLLGFGAVHLLVALIAVRIALGSSAGSGRATSDGALSQLAGAPFGRILLIVIAVGFVALVVARLLEAAYSHRDETGAKAVVMPAYSTLKAALYATLAWSTAKIVLGGGSDGGQTDTFTAQVMSMPGGQVLVVGVGLAVWAYAGGLLRTGLTARYRDKLAAEGWSGLSGSAIDKVARVGYVGKGTAFVLVGLLFVISGLTHDAQQSGGLDQALRELVSQPYGRVAVMAVAVGLAAYGLFAFARARHLRHRS
ncbi:DUF1206 domain-containing protein [Nocardioidaceae bacterium]|nr:DUF1206 domain-containing protein [Nocardioidaceae bacterium]